MNYRLLTIITTVLALTLSSISWSRERDSGLYFVGLVGYTLFDNERQWEDDPNFGAGFGYDFNRRFSVEALGGIADLEGNNGVGPELDQRFVRLDGLFHFNPDEAWRPFLVAGASHNEFEVKRGGGNENYETQYNLGAGIKHEISEAIDLRFDVRGVYGEEDETKDTTMNLGLVAMIGGGSSAEEDSDGDGVYDEDDACPGTTYGVEVDADGCEVEKDSDGDGVMDADDQCPNTTPGTDVDDSGCPLAEDDDGDGVNNNEDQCPATPTGAEVDVQGCPLDTDNDGVADGNDQCPNTPEGAKVGTDGCRERLAGAAAFTLGITFATNSATIQNTHAKDIENLATFLKEYPDTSVEIEGHTDSQGAAAYNKRLSQSRADAVRNTLINKYGIDPDRVTAVGYGEEAPIADNTTAEGRAKNRRVVAEVAEQ